MSQEEINSVTSNNEIQSNSTDSAGKIKCPRCGNRNLQYVTETDSSTVTKGGGYSGGKGCLGYLLFGPFGLLCGNCGSKAQTTTTSTTKRFWVCSDCGEKFRDPADLKAEVEETKQTCDKGMKLGIFEAVMGIILLIIGSAVKISFATYLGIFAIIFGIACYVISKLRLEQIPQLESEYQELERKIRD